MKFPRLILLRLLFALFFPIQMLFSKGLLAGEINVVLECDVLKHKATSVTLGDAYEFDNLSSAPVPKSLQYRLNFNDGFLEVIGGDDNIKSVIWTNGFFVKRNKVMKEQFPYDFQLSNNAGWVSLKSLSFNGPHKMISLVLDGRDWSGNVVHIQNEFVFVTSLSCSYAGTGFYQILDWLTDNKY